MLGGYEAHPPSPPGRGHPGCRHAHAPPQSRFVLLYLRGVSPEWTFGSFRLDG
jgi:hypothetical protein